MATTTNFGWETPDDTDLVKDGAAAIRTLGSAIDTSMVDLKGGTTGQVLSKNSNTDMDFIWVAQDDSNAIQNAIVDAKGDLIGATAADTPARLAVGTNGQVLTADSTASTGLAWTTIASGAYTQLATGSLSGTNLSISSISSSYRDLVLIITGFVPGTNQHYQAFDVYSGGASLSGYDLYNLDSISVTNTATAGSGKYYSTRPAAPGWSSSSNSTSHTVFTVTDYARTGVRHLLSSQTSYTDGNGTTRTASAFAQSLSWLLCQYSH